MILFPMFMQSAGFELDTQVVFDEGAVLKIGNSEQIFMTQGRNRKKMLAAVLKGA